MSTLLQEKIKTAITEQLYRDTIEHQCLKIIVCARVSPSKIKGNGQCAMRISINSDFDTYFEDFDMFVMLVAFKY